MNIGTEERFVITVKPGTLGFLLISFLTACQTTPPLGGRVGNTEIFRLLRW